MRDAFDQVSGLIVAYNAEDTIVRALQSAKSQVRNLIFVDDGSKDNTLSLVRAHWPEATIICHVKNQGIGAARQSAIQACRTEFACWLDSDDEWLPGRVERLRHFIHCGADYVFDEAELYDQSESTKICDLKIPNFLLDDDGLVFQLGRNYIPSIGWPMVRTSVAKSVGYDCYLPQAEDYDHFLKAFKSGYQISLLSGPSGVRQYCSSGSASRNIGSQNKHVARVLSRLDINYVFDRVVESRISDFDKLLVFSMFLTRTSNWVKLHDFLMDYQATVFDGYQKAVYHFLIGVCLIRVSEKKKAVAAFRASLNAYELPESWNNLGVLLRCLGENSTRCFENALSLFPEYLDALKNFQHQDIVVTEVPLRLEAYRSKYWN